MQNASKRLSKKTLLNNAVCFGLFALSVSHVNASGFALIEQSASGQGLSYAGAAASTEDASVMWFNPAGMSYIEGSQAIIAGHLILPNAPFTNDGSEITGTGPLYGKDDDGANPGFVPNLYWKGKLAGYDVGFGLNVPYGSTVSYDQDWVGRYHAVYTKTQTINLNPAMSKKVTDNLTIGAGLNAQYVNVNLTQKINFGQASTPQENDGYADLEASGWGFGYNLGLMYELENKTKIGLAYRSSITQSPEGTADFTLPDNYNDSAGVYADGDLSATIDLPASFSVSVDYPMNDKLNVLADATWMGWSSFKELRIEYDNPQKSDTVQPEEWEDVWRYSIGATYQYSPDLILRSGIALDHTPIPSDDLRTPRIADSDRQWLSVGAGYSVSKNIHLDAGYSYLYGGEPKIEATDADTGLHVLKGQYDIDIHIISAQLVWKY